MINTCKTCGCEFEYPRKKGYCCPEHRKSEVEKNDALLVSREKQIKARVDRRSAARAELLPLIDAGMTLAQIGDHFGVSRERARQKIMRAGLDGYRKRKGRPVICAGCGKEMWVWHDRDRCDECAEVHRREEYIKKFGDRAALRRALSEERKDAMRAVLEPLVSRGASINEIGRETGMGAGTALINLTACGLYRKWKSNRPVSGWKPSERMIIADEMMLAHTDKRVYKELAARKGA